MSLTNINARPAERQVLRADEVARLLGFVCRRSFDNRRAILEAHGFPHKLPGLNGWSRLAVLNWLTANGNVEPEPEAAAPASRLARRFAS